MLINKLDNVEVNLEDGHKYARTDIKNGENIIKWSQLKIRHVVQHLFLIIRRTETFALSFNPVYFYPLTI